MRKLYFSAYFSLIASITGAPATATDLEGTYELTSDPMAADFAEYLEALGNHFQLFFKNFIHISNFKIEIKMIFLQV